mmetsp:Transcript_27383/g.78117  ORF Transcript_27383/g.78117 Transcript_27383/m.78117 type:complete len:234 (-) Transcript_27383:158-859(-)
MRWTLGYRSSTTAKLNGMTPCTSTHPCFRRLVFSAASGMQNSCCRRRAARCGKAPPGLGNPSAPGSPCSEMRRSRPSCTPSACSGTTQGSAAHWQWKLNAATRVPPASTRSRRSSTTLTRSERRVTRLSASPGPIGSSSEMSPSGSGSLPLCRSKSRPRRWTTLRDVGARTAVEGEAGDDEPGELPPQLQARGVPPTSGSDRGVDPEAPGVPAATASSNIQLIMASLSSTLFW